jgi:hypothetical protein
LIRNGKTEEELKVPEFRAAVEKAFGGKVRRWFWSYRVRLCVK